MSEPDSQAERQRLLQDDEERPEPVRMPPISTSPVFTRQRVEDSNGIAAQPPRPPAGMAVMEKLSMSNTPSRASSRAPSPTASDTSDELPNNVSTQEQLWQLPEEMLSGEKERPLRHIDESEDEYHYALRPLYYSVIFILLVELLERFAFYGINYTQTSYLTGTYNKKWNADFDAVSASSYVAISVAVAYTTPFLGAFLADSFLGEYWSIIVGSVCFYIPGLFLIAFTTIPYFLGREFNTTALAVALMFLWPVGTGIVKSTVNVFGAKQFHPLLQSSQIEAYYVTFYMCINIGALVGGIAVPIVAQYDVTQAYFLPVLMLVAGVGLFLLGSSRYVKSRRKGSLFSKKKRYNVPSSTDSSGSLWTICRISLLIIPFNIAYSQMATTFILQGTVMRKAFGVVDAASMNNADAIAVLVFGYLIGNKFYPALARRGIKIPTTYKFAIGSSFGALSILWALTLEGWISLAYENSGKKISIMWQCLSYVLIGVGEIFAVSAAYEVAFNTSPPEKKVLASACNLFCIGGLPNVICLGLYHLCSPWFKNSKGTRSISHLDDYASANVHRYFWVLFSISLFGIFVNLLPQVRKFVEETEEKAVDLLKSPRTPSPRPPRRERAAAEDSPLLRAKRHQAYLKYGTGPVLFKSGSMRAGVQLSERHDASKKHASKSMIVKLYRSDPILPAVSTVITGSGGVPVRAGSLLKAQKKKPMAREEPPLKRSTSQ